jgi:putative ABC transport system substrate-binding protein
VRLPVDIIVAPGTAAAVAARKATTTLPVVIVLAGNPIGDGLIESFSRPGGNATGLTMSVGPEIAGKFLELLKELVPAVSRVAVLSNPLTAPHAGMLKEMEAAARALGLARHPVSARDPVVNRKTATALGLAIRRRCWRGRIRSSSSPLRRRRDFCIPGRASRSRR